MQRFDRLDFDLDRLPNSEDRKRVQKKRILLRVKLKGFKERELILRLVESIPRDLEKDTKKM